MAKLTDSQLVILNGAAQRKNHTVLPLPASLRINKAAAVMVMKSLLKRELIAEAPAAKGDEPWREDEGTRLTLRITDAGVEAINADNDAKAAPEQPPARTAAARKSSKVLKAEAKGNARSANTGTRAGTKLSRMIELLRRKDGATLLEMVKATGWQPHSVRGAMSGALKKRLGLTVTSATDDRRGRVYRIGR